MEGEDSEPVHGFFRLSHQETTPPAGGDTPFESRTTTSQVPRASAALSLGSITVLRVRSMKRREGGERITIKRKE